MRFLAYHYERKVLYCHCEPAEGRRGNLKTSSEQASQPRDCFAPFAVTIYRLFFAKR